MKKAVFLLLALTLGFSCAPKYYMYKLQLNKPKASDELKFEDDKIAIQFVFYNADVAFTLRNNTDKPLKIIWDDASFVYNGEAQKIFHKNVKYIDKEKTQAPTVIPPNSYISDLIQPIDDVKLNENFHWSTQSIFPKIAYYKSQDERRIERVKKILGTKVNIFLPLQQEGKSLDYYFEMEVTDVLYKKNKKQIESVF